MKCLEMKLCLAFESYSNFPPCSPDISSIIKLHPLLQALVPFHNIPYIPL